MATRYALPLILAALLLRPSPARAAAIYWTDSALDTVTRSALDGTTPETVVAGLGYPEGIVVLPEAGEIWWADAGVGAILRADLDGGEVDSVLTGLSVPAGLAVDAQNEKVYWSNVAIGTIHRASLDGTGVEEIIPATGHVRNLAVDGTGGKLYFTGEGNVKLQRANLDGTGVEDLATASNPLGVALDSAAGKVYWVGDGIRRANLDGTQPELLLSVTAAGLAVDAAGGKMYWTALTSPFLRRADLDGSNVEDLVVAGPVTPRALALLVPPGTGAPVDTREEALRLGPPRPNPLRTSVSLAWRSGGAASIRVHDVTGRLVRRLVDTGRFASRGVVEWDGMNGAGEAVPSGVYFVELRDEYGRTGRKVVVAR